MNNQSSLLDIKGVIDLTKLSRSTIYRYVFAGKFPMPSRYGGKFVWREETIHFWINQQIGENKR